MDASQFADLIQLHEAATAVNEKDFPSLIHHNVGNRMRNRRGRVAQEAKPSSNGRFSCLNHTRKDV